MESERSGQVDYHYGFYAAVHFGYEIAHLKLSFQQELELGEQPIRLDMLIIKRNRRKTLKDPIGRPFKRRAYERDIAGQHGRK